VDDVTPSVVRYAPAVSIAAIALWKKLSAARRLELAEKFALLIH